MKNIKRIIYCLLFLSLCSLVKGNDNDSSSSVQLASWRWNTYSNYITFTLLLLFAGICKILFHHTPKLPNYLPESCVLILVGILAGIGVYNSYEDYEHHFPAFTNSLFFNYLLPPIILDSAYTLYDREFLGNLGAVLFFSILGTVFNAFIIGGSLYGLYAAGLLDATIHNFSMIQSLIFSSLISAVDPVAVLAIFEEIGVNMGLYFMVFGESLLNDGVTVVIYNTVISLSCQPNTIETSQYMIAFFSFFTVIIGGLFIGIVIGILTAVILKYTKDTPVIEPLIIMAMGYLAYILSETIHWSGIISLIGCGICQKRYAFPNASQKSYTTIKYGIKTMASISDCIIFIFLGTVTISSTYDIQPYFILWSLILCLVIRFLGVFILSWLLNFHRIQPITYKEQFIMGYGGLRGAVCFSLAIIIPESNPLKHMFVSTTLVIVFFTVFIQGGTIKLFVNLLKIERKGTKDNSIGSMVNEKTIDFVMAGIEVTAGRLSRYAILDALRTFDEHYVKSWLLRKDITNKMTLKLQKVTLTEHFSRLYGPTVLASEASKRERNEEETQDLKENSAELQRKTLKRAFSTLPFESYRNKLKRRSCDNLNEQLDLRRQTASFIEKQLLRKTREFNNDDDDDENQNDENDKSADELRDLRATRRIKNRYSLVREKKIRNSVV